MCKCARAYCVSASDWDPPSPTTEDRPGRRAWRLLCVRLFEFSISLLLGEDGVKYVVQKMVTFWKSRSLAVYGPPYEHAYELCVPPPPQENCIGPPGRAFVVYFTVDKASRVSCVHKENSPTPLWCGLKLHARELLL